MNLNHIVVSRFSAAEAEGIAALGIDPLAILAQSATFLLLFYIVKKFALEKIVATLEERRKTIDKGVRLGQKMEKEHQQLETRIEEMLKEARYEADQIIAGGHQEAGEIIKEAEARASSRVESMIKDASAKLDDDISKAKDDLKKEILELVALASSTVIKEKVSAVKDGKLLQDAVDGVKRS